MKWTRIYFRIKVGMFLRKGKTVLHFSDGLLDKYVRLSVISLTGAFTCQAGIRYLMSTVAILLALNLTAHSAFYENRTRWNSMSCLVSPVMFSGDDARIICVIFDLRPMVFFASVARALRLATMLEERVSQPNQTGSMKWYKRSSEKPGGHQVHCALEPSTLRAFLH